MVKINTPDIIEFIGTFFLTAVVIGSGIMAENLSQGNDAVALLGNTISTGAILFVLIKSFSSISGAHFNPIVSFVFFINKELTLPTFLKWAVYSIVPKEPPSSGSEIVTGHLITLLDFFIRGMVSS